MSLRLLVIAFVCAVFSGCMVGPDYQRPKISVPAKWSEAGELTADARVSAAWWRLFRDDELNRLIAEASAANLDLQQAAARIREARAQHWATLAAALPSLDARGNLSRRRNNFASQGGMGGAFPGLGFGGGQPVIDIFQMGFDATWEVDLFGGVQRAVEAADALLEAETENRRALQVSLCGEVARIYLDLRAHQRLLQVVRDQIATDREILALTSSREQAGLSSLQEVARQQAEVATLEAQLAEHETAIAQATHALSVLLGQAPGALKARLEQARPLPAAPVEIAAELPSTLLLRRPDLRRAERQLAAATAQIGVATADLYPKINLAAFIGLQNTRFTDFTPLGKSWSLASSLNLPIFDWGQRRARIAAKEAQQTQAWLNYQSAVLTAFREVEDALTAHAQEKARLKALGQAEEAAQLALELARERYRKGLTSFIDVLDAQRALHESTSRRIASEAKLAVNVVALYKALGGGWESGVDSP